MCPVSHVPGDLIEETSTSKSYNGHISLMTICGELQIQATRKNLIHQKIPTSINYKDWKMIFIGHFWQGVSASHIYEE